MADNVVIYWVPFKGTMYAANMVTRTFVGISSEERLAASQRALADAGIPQAGWPHGEPLAMEEFGVEVRDASHLDAYISSMNAKLDEHTNNLNLTVGALIGGNTNGRNNFHWVGDQIGAAQGVFATVIDKDTGSWYAVAPGAFWHIEGMAEFNLLRVSRVISTPVELGHAEVVLLQKAVKRGVQEVAPIPPPATYTVVKGDTFNAIAKQLGVTPDALAAANPQVTNRGDIAVGAVLTIPKAG